MNKFMPKLRNIWVNHRTTITVTSILMIAAAMRFYRLDSLPPGLHPDEAANGLDIFRIFDHHDLRPLYATNGPREALFIYLQAIFVGLMGNTVLALRMAPAFIGTLAVGAVYLWAHEWFGRRTAVLAAFIMAITPWGITISRDGFRASLVMLLIPLTLWLYTKALRTGKTQWLVAAGICLGAGLYSYTAFAFLGLALIAVAIFAGLQRRSLWRTWGKQIAVSLGVATIVLIPLGIYAVAHPTDLGTRGSGVSFLNPQLNHGQPLATLGASTVSTLLMFNIHGDENYRHNLGGEPMLNIFIGAMFVLGILVALTRCASLRYFGLLATFIALLVPAMLTAEGLPHALRAIGALAPATVLASLGIGYLLDRWYGVFPINSAARSAGTAAVGVLLLLSVYQGYAQYFIAWANSPKTYAAYSSNSVAIAAYINQDAFAGTRYLVSDEYAAKPIEYLTHYHAKYTRVSPDKLASITAAKPAAEFIIPEDARDEALKSLRFAYPSLKVSPHFSSFNPSEESFSVYTAGKQ